MPPRRKTPWTVYVLADPSVDGLASIRYVGVTSQTLWARLCAHARDFYNCGDKGVWIASLKQRGLRPLIAAVETGTGPDRLERESFWVHEFVRRGCPLTNHAAARCPAVQL